MEKIYNDVYSYNDEYIISRATNWLGRTIFERDSNVKGPNI